MNLIRSFLVTCLLSHVAAVAAVAAGSGKICYNKLNQMSDFQLVYQTPPTADCVFNDAARKGVYATQDIESLSRPICGHGWYFMWSNRCQKGVPRGVCGNNQKGNPYIEGGKKRYYFTSLARADSCTKLQLLGVLGVDKTALKMSDLAKELVVDDVGSGDTVNVCRISVTPLNADVSAVVLDYEVQDNRSPADSAKFIKAISSIVKKYNKKLFLYVNPLNAGGAKTSGLTPELFGDVVDYVDYIGLLITRRKGKALQEDIDDQHGLLAGWGGKLAFVVDISNFTDDEMIVIRKNAFKYKVKFVMLWRNGSSFGDNCSTRSYASVKCLVSGNCSQ